LSFKIPLKLIYPVIVSILSLTGCTSFTGTTKSGVSLSQSEKLTKRYGNYYVSGKMLFKHPEGKHSGEMEIYISANSELRLSIFTPLIGSLIYELRAGPEKFLLLNFQENNYVLEDNNQDVRQTWLGMDLSMTELKWLILGQIPKKTPAWQRTQLSSGELQLVQGSTVIQIHLNSAEQIKSMKKSVEGLPEYQVEIPLYQMSFPKKIHIEEIKGNNRWLMVISEIRTSTGIKKLDFMPPKNMELLIKN